MSGNVRSAKQARQAARAKELEEKKALLMSYKAKSREPGTQPSSVIKDFKKIDNLDEFLTQMGPLVSGKKGEPVTPAPQKETPPVVETKKEEKTVAPSPVTPSPSSGNEAQAQPRKLPTLSIQPSVILFDIPPKETVTVYSKATQTVETAIQTEGVSTDKTTSSSSIHAESASSLMRKKTDQQLPETATEQKQEIKEPVELTQQEKQKIVETPNFIDFIEKSSRIVERALFLGSKYDILKDYSQVEELKEKGDPTEVRLLTKLFDEKWSKHRSITDCSWSPFHKELVLASYSANESGTNDPDGVVLVWSTENTLGRPEYRFNCQSPVMTAFFSEFSPTVILGGTYSGQIVIWDMRAKSSPMQHTPLSSVGHTHPVFTMKLVGTKNGHNLVSASTDGKVCVWSLENMMLPQEVVSLQNSQTKPTVPAPVAVTAMSFPSNETNYFYVGSEEGSIYKAYRHGTKPGVAERFEGHFGPITGLDFHPSSGPIEFSDLFISSSIDWSCKIWSTKSAKPLYSFEDTGDYIYDVKWCPTNPSVFGCVDGTGTLGLWNLNEDTEAPSLKTQASSRALSRLLWSHDGKKILTGDSQGTLFLYDTSQVANANGEEWRKFEQTLVKMSMVMNQQSEESQ